MPEGGVAGSAGAAGAGIRNAPVDGLRTARELGADFANFVAERHDVFEAAPGVLLQVLAAPVGDVDAVLAHHRTAFGWRSLGWLPALRASTQPPAASARRASAIWERALFPVQRKSTRSLVVRRGGSTTAALVARPGWSATPAAARSSRQRVSSTR